MLKENYESVKRRIAEAAKACGRTPESIKLVAVSKGRSTAEIEQLVKMGQKIFGESRSDELEEKFDNVEGVEWHFVGHLQSNKAREVVERCSLIHSVDSIKLLQKIQNVARELDKKQKVLLEVNVSVEESKYGFSEEEVAVVLDRIGQLPFGNVEVLGFMAMAPNTNDSVAIEKAFRELHGLAQEYKFRELSMGMSNDFEIAIRNGATFVRIGRALFE